MLESVEWSKKGKHWENLTGLIRSIKVERMEAGEDLLIDLSTTLRVFG